MRFLTSWVGWLVVPLALLLFLQWPLREWVQAGSREANDLGQVLFALYVAVAVLAASRAGVHLAAGRRTAATARAMRWRSAAVALCLGPWAVFMLWASGAMVAQSALALERFADTLNPGYFVIKLALALLLWLVVAESCRSAWHAWRGRR